MTLYCLSNAHANFFSCRNYHIFYFLLAGASPQLKNKLQLTNPEDYNYLSNTVNVSVPFCVIRTVIECCCFILQKNVLDEYPGLMISSANLEDPVANQLTLCMLVKSTCLLCFWSCVLMNFVLWPLSKSWIVESTKQAYKEGNALRLCPTYRRVVDRLVWSAATISLLSWPNNSAFW